MLISLKKKYKIRSVYGNIDDYQVRHRFKKNLIFKIEQIKVFMTHIAGQKNIYNSEAFKIISNEKPQLLVCGHSHILKISYNKNFNMLHLNSGSCGNTGIHKVKTLLKFKIDGSNIKNLKVIERKKT